MEGSFGFVAKWWGAETGKVEATKMCLHDVFHWVKLNPSRVWSQTKRRTLLMSSRRKLDMSNQKTLEVSILKLGNTSNVHPGTSAESGSWFLNDELRPPGLHYMCDWSEISIYSLISPSILPPVIVSPHSVICVQFRSFGLFVLHFCGHQKGQVDLSVPLTIFKKIFIVSNTYRWTFKWSHFR